MTEAQAAAAERAPRQTRAGGETVTVACKIPTGLRMRVSAMEKDYEPVMGGGTREVKVARLAGEIFINGPATKTGQAPRVLIAGGYALTPGVDKDLFDRWMADNANSDMVKNNLVFAQSRMERTADAAKEAEEVRSNMEPLNGAEDARVPKGRGLKIETGTRAAA